MDSPFFSSSLQQMISNNEQLHQQSHNNMRNNNLLNNTTPPNNNNQNIQNNNSTFNWHQFSVNSLQQQNQQHNQQMVIPSFSDLLAMGNNNNNNMNNMPMNQTTPNNTKLGRRKSIVSNGSNSAHVATSSSSNSGGALPASLSSSSSTNSNEATSSKQVSDSATGEESSLFHPISCINCRKVHKKCDKQLPSCAKCVAKGAVCIYENPKKRGKGSAAYPHKKKKLDGIHNDDDNITTATAFTQQQEFIPISKPSSSSSPKVAASQLYSLRISNLVELYFTFISAGHPFIRKVKLEFFINNFLIYFENGVDIDQIIINPNEYIENVGELKCIFVFYLSILALGHQLLANTDTSDRIVKMCELEIAKLSVEYNLNFYWACSAFHLGLYYNGSGVLQKARYYVRFADFFCLEFPDLTDIIQKNLVKRKVFSVGYYGDSINEFSVFFKNMPNVFEITSNLKLENIVLPNTLEYLQSSNVTPQNFLLFRQVIDFSFAVTTQYRTELMKKMTDCHSPLFFTAQIVLRLMVMNGFKLLFLLKVPEHAKQMAEEVALRITLLAEHDIFTYANGDVSISIKTASRFHLDICKEIEEGKRMNNETLKTSNGKALNVDYFSILEKDLKAMKIHTKKYIRVRNECSGMMKEMEEMLQRHRQRRNLAIILDNHGQSWISQGEKFPDQQDPVLSSVLTYLNELNQQMPKQMTTTPQEEFDSEWRDLFTDSLL